MNYGQIHLTPEELDNFARVLEQFSNQLDESTKTLNNNLQQLGDTWRDPAFAEFDEEFNNTRQNIDNFIKIADEHVAFLRRKAEASRVARDQR
ncbi:MAG TPA: WXG100 family type VII secretion target [Verrucomicrobiota bacterium]|jgi:WXG100 family type VII secretion target|nr:WXG100 family type VII secretion target [Verrucomicrobiota bacterium]